jgi:hypothetical protein
LNFSFAFSRVNLQLIFAFLSFLFFIQAVTSFCVSVEVIEDNDECVFFWKFSLKHDDIGHFRVRYPLEYRRLYVIASKCIEMLANHNIKKLYANSIKTWLRLIIMVNMDLFKSKGLRRALGNTSSFSFVKRVFGLFFHLHCGYPSLSLNILTNC